MVAVLSIQNILSNDAGHKGISPQSLIQHEADLGTDGVGAVLPSHADADALFKFKGALVPVELSGQGGDVPFWRIAQNEAPEVLLITAIMQAYVSSEDYIYKGQT